jgi:hypothetical protein
VIPTTVNPHQSLHICIFVARQLKIATWSVQSDQSFSESSESFLIYLNKNKIIRILCRWRDFDKVLARTGSVLASHSSKNRSMSTGHCRPERDFLRLRKQAEQQTKKAFALARLCDPSSSHRSSLPREVPVGALNVKLQ